MASSLMHSDASCGHLLLSVNDGRISSEIKSQGGSAVKRRGVAYIRPVVRTPSGPVCRTTRCYCPRCLSARDSSFPRSERCQGRTHRPTARFRRAQQARSAERPACDGDGGKERSRSTTSAIHCLNDGQTPDGTCSLDSVGAGPDCYFHPGQAAYANSTASCPARSCWRQQARGNPVEIARAPC